MRKRYGGMTSVRFPSNCSGTWHPQEEIAGVGASVLGCDCLPVDENCKPLRKAILYGIDARSQKEAEWLTQHYGPEGVLARFGHPICSDDVAAKILWIKNHEPEVYEKTFKFLTGSSYITAKLTREFCDRSISGKGGVPATVS